MEPVPLIPKSHFLPNIDNAPLLKKLFQEEFQVVVPSQKVPQNIITSFQHEKKACEEKCDDGEFVEISARKQERLKDFAENVLEAYKNHEKNLREITNAEKNIFETHANYLKRETAISEDKRLQDLLRLKRYPLFQELDENYVEKYKLLQGDVGLPPGYAAISDFRVMNFKKWRRNLETFSPGTLIKSLEKKDFSHQSDWGKAFKESVSADIVVKNICVKTVKFTVKPVNPNGPFKVSLKKKPKAKLSPGINFTITVEFTPKSLDEAAEDVVILAEDGNRLLIPIVAFLEPPILKTHEEINERTRVTAERISSSYIECGECFTGDSKVTKVRFRSFGGSGEFFVMSSDNWNRSYVNSVTFDNMLEIPPFKVYPVFFKIKKGEVIDLFVEFLPKTSGTHVEKIVIACDNGEIASLDLLADAVGWHSYFFTFQDSLLKELPMNKDDDLKVKYYLDFEDTVPNGKVEKVFRVSNNSNMSFEYQWKIREANISSSGEEYLRIPKYQVKISPESGTFEANSIWEFVVTIALSNAELGAYRMVLSLYVLNLPYQCIEEDNTIIQPTGLVRNLYSQSLYGEEECTPELLSLQGTYENLQESIKSYVEYQNKTQAVPKNDFCRTTCLLNPGLCAKPLKKSKTFFNIGENIDDENLTCACRPRAVETESLSESCFSSDKFHENASPQKNEVTWDFVDILVDEIELWVEVLPPRVSLDPSVVELPSSLEVNGPPVSKKVIVTNHNRSLITCSWLRLPKNKGKEIFSPNKENKSASPGPKTKIQNAIIGTVNTPGEISYDLASDEETFTSEKEMGIREFHQVTVEPRETFTVPGLSEFICTFEVSAYRAGKIKERFLLSVNDGDFETELTILGNAVAVHFETSPDILDFGTLRQGARFNKDFQIINKSSGPLFWHVNQFKLEFLKQNISIIKEEKNTGSLEKEAGIIEREGDCAIETYHFDARVPNVKCSILEIEARKIEPESYAKQYVMTLGEARRPDMSVCAPRFENAILALPGKIYVGQKVSTHVILTNFGEVETFFIWGHLFGCHCRKLKVEFFPKAGVIEKEKKLVIRVDVTGLDEGIISHCYVPCFFCRSELPLILSVVAVVEKLHVTFEIIDYPKQTHADVSTFLKSPFYHTVLRIPWPLKPYSPTLNVSHIPEKTIKDLICACAEVEEEVNRAFFDKHQSKESLETAKKSFSFEGGSYEDIYNAKASSRKTAKTLSDENFKTHSSSTNTVEKKHSDENSVQLYSPCAGSVNNDIALFSKSQIDFSDVPYRTPVLRQFAVRNETPIPTTFKIRPFNYGVTKNQPDNRLEKIKRKVFGLNKDEYEDKLSKNQPLVLLVEPSEGSLDGFEAVCINVTAYGNTWGEYRDSLNCEIKGIETFHLKLFIRIVGHPIHFPGTISQTSLKPILRFQPRSYISSPVSAQIKVVNRSAVPLTVSWIVFLTEPLPEEDREDSFNLCVDPLANLESNYSGEDSTKSSKNYIPKNASDSGLPFKNMLEARDFSDSETFEPFAKMESSSSIKEEKSEFAGEEKSVSGHTVTEEEKSQVLHLPFPGLLDNHIFQVNPKEIFFEPFEEKKMTITFNPGVRISKSHSQEVKGVLTGCVKLKPEDERRCGIYYRPCGVNFVSELMDFHGLVETPLVSFELLKGDLKFTVDSNAVIKSPSKKQTISRKFLIKNNNQSLVSMTIETVPGVIFKVKSVDTLEKFYSEYDPEKHALKIDPGQVLEVELLCTVTYEEVMYAYGQLLKKKNRNKRGLMSENLGGNCGKEKEKMKSDKEPWNQYFMFHTERTSRVKCHLENRNGSEANLIRRLSKLDNSVCSDTPDGFGEIEGEYYELWDEEFPAEPKVKHISIIKEELNFVQPCLITQTLNTELHLSFPEIKLSQKSFDFGNVYIGESAVRYVSIINLTGFPTEFRIKAKFNNSDFILSPVTGNLPTSNYNSDIGVTIAIEFRPSEPCYSKQTFHVFCNPDLEFDFYELYVSGFGSWNEKYKRPKFETYTKFKNTE